MLQRLAILLLVCGGLGFFLHREQGRGSFENWERWWLEQVRSVEGPRPPAPPVVLVELRRGDLPFESWPPAPLDYALVFESLVRRQPREVVVQPLLAWPGVEVLDAATLAERIALLPRGVLACTLQRGLEGAGQTVGGGGVALPLPVLPSASGDIGRVPDFEGPGQVPIDELRGSKPLGFTRIELGAASTVVGHGVAVPLVARRGAELVPSLAIQALLAWRGGAPGDVVVQLGRRISLGGGIEVPVDASGRLVVSSRLAPPLRKLDAGALLLDLERDAGLLKERGSELETLRSLEGALVVVGETGESTPRFALPGAPEGGWTEAEVLARGLVAALSGFHLRELPPPWPWVGWAGVAAAAAGLLACPRAWVAFFGLGGGLVIVLACALGFLNGQWWMPPVPPLGVWLAGTLVAFVLAPVRPKPPAAGSAETVSAPPSSAVVASSSIPAEPIPVAKTAEPAPTDLRATADEPEPRAESTGSAELGDGGTQGEAGDPAPSAQASPVEAVAREGGAGLADDSELETLARTLAEDEAANDAPSEAPAPDLAQTKGSRSGKKSGKGARPRPPSGRPGGSGGSGE